MFADKNNHLLKQILKKKRKGGSQETPSVKTLPFSEQPPDELEEPQEEPSQPQEPSQQEESSQQEKTTYPDTNYLYKNITSNKNGSSMKTNVCAFYSQESKFLKYIVETKEGENVIFPSFMFETSQKGGFLDNESTPTDLDKLFEKNVTEFVKTFFAQKGGDLQARPPQQEEEFLKRPSQMASPSREEEEFLQPPPQPVSQSRGEEEFLQPQDGPVSPLEKEPTSPSENDMLRAQEIGSEKKEVQVDQQPEDNFVKPEDNFVKPEDNFVKPKDNFAQPEDNVVKPEDNFAQPEDNFVQPDDLLLSSDEAGDSPKYIGYIMVNEEPFVFVNIGSTKPLSPNYHEAVLNELFHTFKVFDSNVDQTVRDLFNNNRWLLNDEQPYSGYMCALNEANQLVNIKVDEENADLINVDSIGDFYYFSFSPLDKENATQYKRFAIFPNEYVCILDDTQMEEYKENKVAYAEDKSIYLKGETLTDKKPENEFMCVKTPSQFAQY